jgi:hypothetical protein
MQKFIISIIAVFFTLSAAAQTYTIKGRLTDESGAGLPAATVLLLNERDSVMVNYALSNTLGHFEIKNVTPRQYLVRFSYVGFSTRTVKVEIPSGNTLDMGVIKLPVEARLLKEAVVQQERIPMRVKNDTIEYDALAFKPLPNEMVEDLLKRMPGIVVAADGSVEAQGEQVRRVLVDGREFFGRDPKMATQNLPADAVSKIHVFDQKSEQAQFTGIDDGRRERTMNLELKEDRKEAAFGNASAGVGPDNRFQGRANLNRFNKKGQISLLAMGNNLNQQGFSIGEYMNFTGNAQSLASGRGMNVSFGGGGNSQVPVNFDGRSSTNGLMTSWAGGVNFNRRMGTKTEITTSYFFNQLDHDMSQNLDRENYLPSGNYNFSQVMIQDNQNYNHRINLKLDHKFSETSSMVVTSSGLYNTTDTWYQTQSKTFSTQDVLQNQGNQEIKADGNRLDLTTNILWRQRFARPGRTLTASADFTAGINDQESDLKALNEYIMRNTTERILQNQLRNDNSTSYATGITFTEPLGNRIFLESNYQFSAARNEVNREVYDLNDENRNFNALLSNHYINNYTWHRGGLNLLVNRTSYNLTLGSALQASDLRGQLITFDRQINKSHLHVLPVARFNYNFTNAVRLTADYETNVQEPSATQLQPVIDNRDPLNIYQGNPELKPAYRHRMQMRFNSFNPINSFGYFAFMSADYTTAAIANAVNVSEFMVRTTMPVNTGNNLSLRASLNTNFSLTKLKSRVMIGATANRMESVNVLNETYQDIVNNIINGNVRYIFRPVDAFELRLAANANQQITHYQFSNNEQAFLNQSYSSDVNWSFLKHYRIQSSYSYQIYQGRTAQFDRKIPMLDMSLSRSFLKNNSGELKFSVYNLLNKELGVTQTAATNYYEQSVTNSLGRYFLLSFTYSLNRQLNMMEGGPGGGRGMRMITH